MMNLKKVLKHRVEEKARLLASQVKAKRKTTILSPSVLIATKGLSVPLHIAIVCAPLGHGEVSSIEIQSSSEVMESLRCRSRKAQGSIGAEEVEGDKCDDKMPLRSQVRLRARRP